MRGALLCALALLPAACGGESATTDSATTGVPAPVQREVVSAALARLDAQVAALDGAPQPIPADLDERLAGLFETLHAGRDATRALAREELLGLGDAAVPGLEARLADRALAAERRAAAAELLAALDTPASAEALLRRLETARVDVEREPWLYAQCAWRLGQTRQTWTAPRLYLCLKYETDHASVVWAADSLARMGLLSGLDALFVVANDGGNDAVRAEAEGVLERLRAELGCADWFELAALWNEGQLERLPPGPEGPRYEREVWRNIQALSEWQLRGVDDARFTLSHLRELAAEQLALALQDSDVYVRLHSAQCLGRMGPRARAAADALADVLDDPQVGATAAEALGRIAAQGFAPTLIAQLDGARPLELRVAAVRALGLLSPAGLEAVLAPRLADSAAPDLAAAAAEALLTSGQVAAGSPNELDALRVARSGLTSGAVEPSTCEAALGRWLERHAGQDPAAAEAWQHWQDLADSSAPERLEARSALLAPFCD